MLPHLKGMEHRKTLCRQMQTFGTLKLSAHTKLIQLLVLFLSSYLVKSKIVCVSYVFCTSDSWASVLVLK